MPCYSPWVGYYDKAAKRLHHIGKTEGKDPIREAMIIWRNSPFAKSWNEENMMLLPCGKCLGCRLEYSKEWANRCVLEAKTTQNNWFMTLTYDEEHIKECLKPVIDKETGEYGHIESLIPNHLSEFIKELRRNIEYHKNLQGVRFYGCGEYGSRGGRPHYHLLMYNLPLDDLAEEWKKDGFITFSSENVSRIWGKGIVTVNEFSWETAAYTARYMLKKLKGRDAKEQYKGAGIEPEFSRCSRRPGIGYEYYRQNRDKIYQTDSIVIHGTTCKPPTYFDRMFKEECPERWAEIQEQRAEVSRNEMRMKLNNTTLNYKDQLKVEEANREDKIKLLGRQLEY